MKSKQISEVVCVYIFIYSLTILFNAVFHSLSIVSGIVAQLLLFAVIGLSPVLMCKIMKRPLSTLGYSKEKMLKQLRAAFIVLLMLFMYLTILTILVGGKLENTIGEKTTNVLILIRSLITTFFFVGFSEETLFRGYFLERIKTATNSDATAIVISSVMFGLWHYPANHSLMQVGLTTVIGFIIAISHVKLKNCTTFSVGLAHGTYDASLALLRFFVL